MHFLATFLTIAQISQPAPLPPACIDQIAQPLPLETCVANQPYSPPTTGPGSGAPDGTIGSGTR